MGMRETIILAPGLRENEMLKSLALHSVNCINLKIMGAAELARYTLLKTGVAIKEEYVSPKEEAALVAKAVKGILYFENATYTDIKRIASSIKRMRKLVVAGDEKTVLKETLEKGIFTEKNAALYNTYEKYMKLLSDSNAFDSVSLVRKAIAEGKPFDADFVVLNEYPLSPLEQTLIAMVSSDKYETRSIMDLYKATNPGLKIESIKNCYGAPNEVETILTDIYEGKTLDQCTVALTDAGTYSQLFFDYALLHDIPVTFGCGVPIINSNPARLLVMYYHWITDGFFGKEALEAMLHSKAFNRAEWKKNLSECPEGFSWSKFTEVLDGLRLTNDKTINEGRIEGYKKAIADEEKNIRKSDEKAFKEFNQRKLCIPYLEKIAAELSLPTEEFIKKYSYIRKGSEKNADVLLMKLDMAAVNAIYNELGVIREAGVTQSAEDLISNVLKIGICGETSEAGKVHITDISGAIASARDNLYIAGLSASKYPGSPKEDYLLLDADLKLFGDGINYLTSEGKIAKKREQLMSLVHLAAGLGAKVYVSYSGLNVSELKKDNASSLVFELYREEAGQNATLNELEAKIDKVDYFAPAISATRELGKAYNAGKRIITPARILNQDTKVSVTLDREWSPSAINKFLEDPQGFMMVYLLNIPEPEEYNPFTVITPIEAGNMAHGLMERLANTNLGRDEFLSICDAEFDRFITTNPPLIPGKIQQERDDFRDMMGTAYDTDPKREVVLKEEDIHCTHESGVKLRGLPDRVEKLDDGTFLVVDFKTGRNVKHHQDEIETCLQVVIYAYMLEQQGLEISGGEFRYLRSGEVVTCKYDEEMKQALNDVLISFKHALENFSYMQLASASEETATAEEI